MTLRSLLSRRAPAAPPATAETVEAGLDTLIGRDTTIPIAEVQLRSRAMVAGTVRSMRIQPWGDAAGREHGFSAPSIELSLVDGGGRVDVIFLGRQVVEGIDLGSRLRVEGMVGLHHGRPAILNPLYSFIVPNGIAAHTPTHAPPP